MSRILITCPLALPHVGGVEILVHQEIQALVGLGHDVTLVTSSIGGKGETPVYPDAVRVIRVPASDWPRKRFGLYVPLFSPRLLPILIEEVRKADVVHGHSWMGPNTVLALVLAAWYGKRAILTEHNGIQPRKSTLASLVTHLAAETAGRLCVLLADRCVAYNGRIIRQLVKLGRRKLKVAFVPYTVDGNLFYSPSPEQRKAAREKLGWPEDRKKVLFVGRFVREKGIPLLLEAVDPACYDIVFCGAGDVCILGKVPRDGVEYLPPRPQRELVPLYHAADLLILPSYVEGFPLVAREALACGLPVVLGYDEGYEPYRGLPGLRFCPLTVEGVQLAIRETLNSPPMGVYRAPIGFPTTPGEWIMHVFDFK